MHVCKSWKLIYKKIGGQKNMARRKSDCYFQIVNSLRCTPATTTPKGEEVRLNAHNFTLRWRPGIGLLDRISSEESEKSRSSSSKVVRPSGSLDIIPCRREEGVKCTSYSGLCQFKFAHISGPMGKYPVPFVLVDSAGKYQEFFMCHSKMNLRFTFQ